MLNVKTKSNPNIRITVDYSTAYNLMQDIRYLVRRSINPCVNQLGDWEGLIDHVSVHAVYVDLITLSHYSSVKEVDQPIYQLTR